MTLMMTCHAHAIRNLMQMLRESGERVSGPAPLDPGDRRQFANQLDRFLTRPRLAPS